VSRDKDRDEVRFFFAKKVCSMKRLRNEPRDREDYVALTTLPESLQAVVREYLADPRVLKWSKRGTFAHVAVGSKIICAIEKQGEEHWLRVLNHQGVELRACRLPLQCHCKIAFGVYLVPGEDYVLARHCCVVKCLRISDLHCIACLFEKARSLVVLDSQTAVVNVVNGNGLRWSFFHDRSKILCRGFPTSRFDAGRVIGTYKGRPRLSNINSGLGKFFPALNVRGTVLRWAMSPGKLLVVLFAPQKTGLELRFWRAGKTLCSLASVACPADLRNVREFVVTEEGTVVCTTGRPRAPDQIWMWKGAWHNIINPCSWRAESAARWKVYGPCEAGLGVFNTDSVTFEVLDSHPVKRVDVFATGLLASNASFCSWFE
jgi:hypothetical protein